MTPGVAKIATCSTLPVARSDICTFKLLRWIKFTATFLIWCGTADVALLTMRKVVRTTNAHPIASAHWLIVLLLRNVTPLNQWRAQVSGPFTATHDEKAILSSQKNKLDFFHGG